MLIKAFGLPLMALALVGCQAIVTQYTAKPVSYHFGYYDDSPIKYLIKRPEHIAADESGFLPLKNGNDALAARLALIESAERSLDLQYYIFRNDETSKLILWRLYEAAERGVRIRLLLDDMQGRNDSDMAYLNAHPNIDIRLFNPHQYRRFRLLSWLTEGKRLNHRMHNKSMTADGVATIVGGRNIGNEYFAYRTDVDFGDFDLLLYGDVVEQTEDQFDLYWNSDFTVPMSWVLKAHDIPDQPTIDTWHDGIAKEFQYQSQQYDFKQLAKNNTSADELLPMHWGKGKLIYDKPEKVGTGKSKLNNSLSQLLANVEHSLVLISPYFVPTKKGTQELINSAKNGKKIIILTNSLASNDVFAVHGWYAKRRKALLEGGIELWEMKAEPNIQYKRNVTGSNRSSLHAKMMMIDEKQLFVGSMNMDPRSAELNTEMAVLLDHPAYVESAKTDFQNTLKDNAYELKLKDGKIVWIDHQAKKEITSDPGAGFLLTLSAWFTGLLPIEQWL